MTVVEELSPTDIQSTPGRQTDKNTSLGSATELYNLTERLKNETTDQLIPGPSALAYNLSLTSELAAELINM